jgi:tRNA modification GTPase
MKSKSNTIVALATAIGAGSIAIVRVSGEDSIKTANKVFMGKDLELVEGNTVHFGRIKDEKSEIDQVLVSVFKSPNSYTGENSVEISCHSNHFIVEDVINILIRNGARMAEPGEFTLRAFLNHKIDLSQAEAISNIVSSKSRLATRNSIMQLEGGLSERIIEIKANLIDLISFMELDLDFSEEELEIIPASEVLNKINESNKKIEELIESFNKAKYLSGALEIAIIGKPNAGKSLLLNTLLGEDRAIVTNIPGTTRDTIEENLTLKNMLLKISDTAGIRFSKNHVEAKGIQRTWKRVDRADIVLWVIDISKNINNLDKEILNKLKNYQDVEIIIVGNKADLKTKKDNEKKIESFSLPNVNISAKTGKGLNKLKEKISEILGKKYNQLGEEIIITNKRQVDSLKQTNKYLLDSKKTIESGAGNEFTVVELRNALDALGQITGETATEDILNNIFSGFCIGK